MTLRLNFNTAAVRSQLNLQIADRLLAGSTERLSSGIALNRSADDPAGLSIANSLRYQLRGINTATENVENSVNMISTAEGALDEVTANLNRIRSLAVAAANEGAQDAPQLQALQTDLNESISSINRIADNTQFGNRRLLNGSFAQNTWDRETLDSQNLRSIDYYDELNVDYRQLQNGITSNTQLSVAAPSGDLDRSSLSVTFAGAPAETTLIQGITQNGTALSGAAGNSVELTGPLGSVTLSVDAGTTIEKMLDRINGTTGLSGLRAQYDDTTGVFTIESTSFGASTISAVSSADMSGGSDQGLFDSDTTDPAVNANVSLGTNQTVEVTYADRLGTQVVTLTQDPNLNGGRGFTNGGLTLTMKDRSDDTIGSTSAVSTIAYSATRINDDRAMIGAKEGQHALLDIPDVHGLALGQDNGISGYSNLNELMTGNALLVGDAQQALQVIDAAIEEVSQIRGRLGSIQASSLESTVTYLRINNENLSAAESRIRDTDFAVESAEYARQQTLLQAATAMLSQANQTPQQVIRLLSQ